MLVPTRNSEVPLVPCPLEQAAVAQLAERVICNLEVTGSIPVGGFYVPRGFLDDAIR